ncbi:FAD-dependent oxidoreductase [Dyadobacter fanqingshengii]|uniref:FAD-dependent oxidoreductase n=1 Tax=Dyadobacter fanqingshengii TaxID=2906443 RepID=A0A9X1P510_9BACT|nr:FAD-dependent oxidoreductase [Dyadobacter fanqingshengii]MCF0038979.1 FAD-dependent oxidoreductase [Dyadobacter fanqingshengii]USJ34199.1 FAD-dependent oxidoreductase [Dyadobacter fanqingshengii]
MKRRNFLGSIALGGSLLSNKEDKIQNPDSLQQSKDPAKNLFFEADMVVAGGGLGGCAAALAALRNGLSVILTEETDWLGGQLSQQGVPPDEHQWIETHGATQLYRDFRTVIRQYYINHYPLTDEARNRKHLNPGDGAVSRLCHEPRVAVAVLNDMFMPYISSGKLTLLIEHKAISADVDGNKVRSLEVVNVKTKTRSKLSAPYFVDATELGDLLPITGTEFVTGTESKSETNELHAPEKGNPENNQAFTVCFAIDYRPGENHVIEKPVEYAFWKDFIPKMTKPWSGKLLDLSYSNPKTLEPKQLGFHPAGIKTGDMLNLWNYRRIISKDNFKPGTYAGDITIVNWPQNDYFLGNLIGASQKDFEKHVNRAKQLSLSLLYWLQTEAPRPDGGKGWPEIRLRKDIMGTEDGLAKYPYVRESRRIKALFTIKEEHVGAENRAIAVANGAPGSKDKASNFHDSVGVGYYHIDLHPSSAGDNYIDFASLPFQIPLGALLPVRMENLLPANKNIGTTHITNGCYRLHPVEWSIGEAVGLLVKFAGEKGVAPRVVREREELLIGFQGFLKGEGVELGW